MINIPHLPWVAACVVILFVVGGTIYYVPRLRARRQQKELAIIEATPPEQRAAVTEALARYEQAAGTSDLRTSIIDIKIGADRRGPPQGSGA